MTWTHVLIIVAAMALVVVCDSTATCAIHSEGILQLSTMVAGGAIGHAGHNIHRSTKTPSRKRHK